LKGE
jgi:hypothetical protein